MMHSQIDHGQTYPGIYVGRRADRPRQDDHPFFRLTPPHCEVVGLVWAETARDDQGLEQGISYRLTASMST